MIENINIATKAEIQNEMGNLETQYKERETELKNKTQELINYIQETDKYMSGLSERYNLLKREIDKREGRNNG